MSLTVSRSSPVRFPATWASVYFDLLRGLAAFFVLFQHWRVLFFVDSPRLEAHRLLLAALYIPASVAHQSVILFFVLSGYFIGGTVFRALERDQWEWGGYLLRRIVRLWIVLVPALFLCLFWDRLGIHLGRAPGLYSGQVRDYMVGNVAPRLAPHVFFGNLFFLQNILTPIFGSNGALWSLANEFWYYILFPLGLTALWRTQRAAHRLLCAALFALTAWFIGAGILVGFPIWLAGVALLKLQPLSFTPRNGRFLRLGASLCYAPIFFGFGRLPMVGGYTPDYAFTLITTLFLWILLSANTAHPPHARVVQVSRESARFSYTLYANHVPFLVFLTAIFVGDFRWHATATTLLAGVGILLVVLAYSWGLAFLTEFRTDALRLRLERLFGVAELPPILPSSPLSETEPTS